MMTRTVIAISYREEFPAYVPAATAFRWASAASYIDDDITTELINIVGAPIAARLLSHIVTMASGTDAEKERDLAAMVTALFNIDESGFAGLISDTARPAAWRFNAFVREMFCYRATNTMEAFLAELDKTP